jgi:hypothetical protein
VPIAPPEVLALPPEAPPEAGDPPLPVELAGVADEQAVPAIANIASVVRKKQLDVMRSFYFGIL